MSIKKFCEGLYNFFAWPFRKIAQCFTKNPEPIVSPREPEAKLSPTLYLRAKVYKLKKEEEQGKVHFKPLFLPFHFSKHTHSKNDKEFKDRREQERRRLERVKARIQIMESLKKLEEVERLESEEEILTARSQVDSPISPTTPDKW